MSDFALRVERCNGEWTIWSHARDREGADFITAVLTMIEADLARAIEARMAETALAGSVHESAIGEADAPKSPGKPEGS